MADLEGAKDTKDFHLDVPARNQAFFLKGSGALGLGHAKPAGADF